jgi:hypothetical protein
MKKNEKNRKKILKKRKRRKWKKKLGLCLITQTFLFFAFFQQKCHKSKEFFPTFVFPNARKQKRKKSIQISMFSEMRELRIGEPNLVMSDFLRLECLEVFFLGIFLG